MFEWRRICCAVDFSESAQIAMRMAAAAAGRVGAELSLVHVVVPLPAARHEISTASAMRAAVEQAEIALARWREEAEGILGRPVSATVLTGPPATEVLRFVRDGRFELLVVGTHGRTGLRRLLIGSIAERLVREAPCPVLVARVPEFEGGAEEPKPGSA